jgi:hypothetical protein
MDFGSDACHSWSYRLRFFSPWTLVRTHATPGLTSSNFYSPWTLVRTHATPGLTGSNFYSPWTLVRTHATPGDTATEFQRRRVLGRIAIVGSGDLDIVDGCHACTTSRREDLMCGRCDAQIFIVRGLWFGRMPLLVIRRWSFSGVESGTHCCRRVCGCWRLSLSSATLASLLSSATSCFCWGLRWSGLRQSLASCLTSYLRPPRLTSPRMSSSWVF